MDWVLVGEAVKVLGPVATAGAAWFAAIIAYRGLNKWRAETIGKRKAELAEEVLADFYQARDIINAARSPGSFSHEGATRQRAGWGNKEEFFAQFHARRYRFMAHFGLDAGKPYDDLHGIYVQIVVAVGMLIKTYQRRTQGSPPPATKWEATIGWAPPEDDKIPSQLEFLINEIERICRPAIQEAAK